MERTEQNTTSKCSLKPLVLSRLTQLESVFVLVTLPETTTAYPHENTPKKTRKEEKLIIFQPVDFHQVFNGSEIPNSSIIIAKSWKRFFESHDGFPWKNGYTYLYMNGCFLMDFM